jgi:predicted MPP superfamily phosphohydrolase
MRPRRWIYAGDASRSSGSTRARTRPGARAPSGSRILLCHYPLVFDKLEPGAYHLVLAGHLHDGQITIPYGAGKVRLAHFNWRYTRGLYRRGGSVMHVSAGLGTTFVPFRFGARPEATELVLLPADEERRRRSRE